MKSRVIESDLNVVHILEATKESRFMNDEEHAETKEVVYAVVVGLCCTVLICILFMPLAKKWDKFITIKFCGKTVFAVQHIDQDQSSHLSEIVVDHESSVVCGSGSGSGSNASFEMKDCERNAEEKTKVGHGILSFLAELFCVITMNIQYSLDVVLLASR
jgi:hypothetical protein